MHSPPRHLPVRRWGSHASISITTFSLWPVELAVARSWQVPRSVRHGCSVAAARQELEGVHRAGRLCAERAERAAPSDDAFTATAATAVCFSWLQLIPDVPALAAPANPPAPGGRRDTLRN